jgi:hypothetical protein
MVGGFAFAASLIPTLLSKESKPSRVTSLVTFLVLVAFWICYVSLGLWLATVSTGLTSVGWLILFIQGGANYGKKKKDS